MPYLLSFFFDCKIDWTAIGTMLLAIAAFITIPLQNHQFKKLRADEYERSFKDSSVALITKFDDLFNDELYDARHTIGKIITENNLLDQKKFDYESLRIPLEEVYDFFDTLGFFVNKKYLKPEVVHHYFHHWFSKYFELYNSYHIQKLSKQPNTVWMNLANLNQQLNKIELELLGKPTTRVTKQTLSDFFKDECSDIN